MKRWSTQMSWLDARTQSLNLTEFTHALQDAYSSSNLSHLALALEKGDFEAVTALSCDPRAYHSAADYMRDAIPAKLFKKLQDLPVSINRKANTIEKWYAAEAECYRTNLRLRPFLPGKFLYSDSEKAISRHIDGVRKIVASFVGKGPSSDLEPGFSPGSTLTDRGWQATAAHKISNRPSCTPQLDAAGYPDFVGTLWHHNMVDAGQIPDMRDGGEYFTVPKTSKVDRAAELQPSLNISRQLSLGRNLKRRLRSNTGWVNGYTKHQGWCIEKAQEIHAKVAREASVSRSFATIDLSSASDTVSKVLVELLMPHKWFRALDNARTHRVTIPAKEQSSSQDEELLKEQGLRDKTVYLEKFSSMGNGFTFELETILFAAIACYITRINGYWGELGFDVFVYGDDIIVRDELYDEVKAMLRFFGFSVNTEKSFHGDHPFRESCGGDYFDGHHVAVPTLEKYRDLSPAECVSFANQVKALSERYEAITLQPLNRAWFHVLSYIPKGIRSIRGPSWLGDCVIHDPSQDYWITRRNPDVRSTTEIKILSIDTSEAWLPWFQFDPSTQLACAVLRFGDGKRGLLPRKPNAYLRTDWATLWCS